MRLYKFILGPSVRLAAHLGALFGTFWSQRGSPERRILSLGAMGGGPGWGLRVRPVASAAAAEPSGRILALKGPKGPHVELGGPLRAPRARM